MRLEQITMLARSVARRVYDRWHTHKTGPWFRLLSACWRGLRACHLRIFRRQPPLLIVLDGPATLSGFGAITGWAISRDARIVRVEAFVRGRLIACAEPCEPRRDIAQCFPHYRAHGLEGFRLAPEPSLLEDGRHELVIRATDARGRVATLRTVLAVSDYRLADRGDLPPHLHGSDREYQAWRRHHQVEMEVEPARGEAPLISVIMPIYRPDLRHLRTAIDSVRRQSHANWQLCLCDDGSQQSALARELETLAASDARVLLSTHCENRGIAAATNTALGLATGDYVAFLDQDDALAPHALAEVARAAAKEPVDLLYSDWDRLDGHGCHIEPFFKPGWSPDLLNSMMYLAHLTVYRRAFLERIGWCRSEFDGTQDWDLALRATAQTNRILHIPLVLYHWRLGGVSAGDFNRVCHERGRRAIERRLQKSSPGVLQPTVEDGPTPCTFYVRYTPREWPLVSILIPTRDNPRLLRRCLHSLRRLTIYPRYEILVIDNGSTCPQARRFLRSCGERVVRMEMPFNHSRLNNQAAQMARGEVLVLLNDDTEVISREWLRALVEQALRPEVGAVGAWLFHPDGRTQHAGIVLGLGPVATPLHSGITRDGIDRGTTRLSREVSAVTGACLAMRKDLYSGIGGLDETGLPTSFNDVDLCLRLRRAGYRIIMQPLARLYHHESATRRVGDETPSVQLMHERWGDELQRDPCWNPNLPCGAGGSGFAINWDVARMPLLARRAQEEYSATLAGAAG
jgi:glycosyltransferase involved in cell wall biosynthesis